MFRDHSIAEFGCELRCNRQREPESDQSTVGKRHLNRPISRVVGSSGQLPWQHVEPFPCVRRVAELQPQESRRSQPAIAPRYQPLDIVEFKFF